MRSIVWLLLSGWCFAALSSAGAADRYSGRLENGTLIAGSDVGPWQETKASPVLTGKGNFQLLNAGNHVRWLRNNELPLPTTPAAYVEFIGGDRLPGKATAYRTGGETPFDRQPPHLLVDHPHAFDWPTTDRESLRVATRWLRRIVWQSRVSDRYQPGMAFLRDGRQLRYRSLRFIASGARLLLEEQTQDVPFSQMAELHLPRTDPWDAYHEQLAAMATDNSSRLMRLETTDGLIATATTERFAAKIHESNQPQHWLHVLQPAWCLDPIWMRFRTIQLRRYWLPHQPALSDVDPSRVGDAPSGGGHWMWRKDRNVQGGVLRAGGEDFGWGLGDHAPSTLTFPLPAEARSFRSKLALDQLAGQGGCARALVHLGDSTTPAVFRSDFLIGSKNVISPPAIALPPASGNSRTLTLVADAAHRDRPAGAEPLNIRDFVDWLEPELELDRAELQRQVRRRMPAAMAAWDGWALESPQKNNDLAEPIELFSRWDESDAAAASFRLEAAPRVAGLRLTRTLKLGARDNWLCLAVSRFDGAPIKLDLRVNGSPAGALDVPQRVFPQGDPNPILVSLRAYHGKDTKIEIILPSGGAQKLDWRGIAILEQPPGLLRLFDEEPDFAKRLNSGEGKAEVITTDRYLGSASLKVTPPDRGAARLLSTPAAIRERPKLGEYRYLRFAWKKEGGQRIALQIAHDGHFGPADPKETASGKSFRFDAGIGQPAFGSAVRLAREAPRGWTDYTRDLYAEFGAFDLTGLSFAALDGDTALFDHIYLVRTLEDLQKIEVRPAGK